MMQKYLVVSSEIELSLPFSKIALQEGRTPIITGVGGINVIKSLSSIPRCADILNVGYCGGFGYPVGSAKCVKKCKTYHPNVNFSEETFDLQPDGVFCFTAGDFVVSPEGLTEKCIIDMELAYICAMGFRSVRSVKYVSDNLNYAQYKNLILCTKK